MSKKFSVIVNVNKSGTETPNRFFIKTMPAKNKEYRPDKSTHRAEYKRNRKAIIAAGDVCAICGRPIDKTLRFPDPMSASVDHIIPIAKGGHPSDPQNLQLAHLICNQMKYTKQVIEANQGNEKETKKVTNRVLPLSADWQRWTERKG